ncbi:hypothetical protein J7L36_01430, partial [bacterium]|nr:hypothetical protein [bacterium]
MSTLIAILILMASLVGMAIILLRKIPILVTLPESFEVPEREDVFLLIKKKIKQNNPFKNFSYELFLQKILSKVK